MGRWNGDTNRREQLVGAQHRFVVVGEKVREWHSTVATYRGQLHVRIKGQERHGWVLIGISMRQGPTYGGDIADTHGGDPAIRFCQHWQVRPHQGGGFSGTMRQESPKL